MSEAQTSGRLLVTAREAAQLLGVSERHLFNLTKRGEIACVRLGRSVRYYLQTLLDWIKRKEAGDGERI